MYQSILTEDQQRLAGQLLLREMYPAGQLNGEQTYDDPLWVEKLGDVNNDEPSDDEEDELRVLANLKRLEEVETQTGLIGFQVEDESQCPSSIGIEADDADAWLKNHPSQVSAAA